MLPTSSCSTQISGGETRWKVALDQGSTSMKLCSEVDYASAGQRCRDLDVHGISGYVCREDPEAPPHHFCHYLYLGLHLVMARLPLDGGEEHLAARDNRIAGNWITVLMGCIRHGVWLNTSQLAISFFRSP